MPVSWYCSMAGAAPNAVQPSRSWWPAANQAFLAAGRSGAVRIHHIACWTAPAGG